MPLVRLQVRNEYGLGEPELHGEADREDPKALLNGVAVAGLVGILRQLGDLAEIKDVAHSKPPSILCRSFCNIDTNTMEFPHGDGQGHMNIFRAVKHCLPGPYTFILTASKELPKQCTRYGTTAAKYAHRKCVRIQIPDDAICQSILERMDSPLISTSVKGPKDDEWMIDPVVMADSYEPEGLDFVVDGGIRVADPSTVADMVGRYPKILRQGKGPKLSWMVAEDNYEAADSEKDLIAGGA